MIELSMIIRGQCHNRGINNKLATPIVMTMASTIEIYNHQHSL